MASWRGERLRRFDRRWLSQGASGLLGIDEAGRGCLAGPVTAACVWIPAESYRGVAWARHCRLLDDSKRLSPSAREDLFAALVSLSQKGVIVFATAEGSVDEIASENILGATRLAMRRALETVAKEASLTLVGIELTSDLEGQTVMPFASEPRPSNPPLVLVDGNPLTPFPWSHHGIVGGDGKSLAIAAASILAKVSRDRVMVAADAVYPGYNFVSNKGYGSCKVHQAQLLKVGPCELHRRHFLRKLQAKMGASLFPELAEKQG